MSNYYAHSRSNYFKVKNVDEFKAFCDKIGVEMIKSMFDNEDNFVGFVCSLDAGGGGIPSSVYDKDTDVCTDFDICEEVSKHLLEGEVAVFIEISHEKLRYLAGNATAVNWKGEVEQITLNNIYEQAVENLGGNNVSRAEY